MAFALAWVVVSLPFDVIARHETRCPMGQRLRRRGIWCWPRHSRRPRTPGPGGSGPPRAPGSQLSGGHREPRGCAAPATPGFGYPVFRQRRNDSSVLSSLRGCCCSRPTIPGGRTGFPVRAGRDGPPSSPPTKDCTIHGSSGARLAKGAPSTGFGKVAGGKGRSPFRMSNEGAWRGPVRVGPDGDGSGTSDAVRLAVVASFCAPGVTCWYHREAERQSVRSCWVELQGDGSPA